MSLFQKLRISASAQTLVDQALSRVSSADRATVQDLLVAAAQVDHNRFLTAAEAGLLVSTFEEVAATGTLAGPQLAQAAELAHARLSSRESLANVDGISSHFTFDESLEQKLISELYAAVDRAHGRPMDVNMMIFEFQSDEIEQAIADIAKTHPNITFRIIGDSGQASTSGGNALPSLLKLRLPNVQVKFKRDFPYVWSEDKKRPVYNHGATAGLNHHKGFCTLIDGVPDRLVTGSFNWSDTADEKNYEDLSVLHSVDASTRNAVVGYAEEFAGFFNNDEACLSPANFENFKRDKWNEMLVAHGQPRTRGAARRPDGYARYVVPVDERGLDINGFRKLDRERLTELLGSTLAKAVETERKKNGRFGSFEELTERVAALSTAPTDVQAALADWVAFGSHQVSINNASVEELDQAGFSTSVARSVVEFREQHGDFESVDELLDIPGMTRRKMSTARPFLTALDVESFFNSRPYGAPAGGTGYGPGNDRLTAVMNANGQVERARASVTVAATDLFNRAKPGQTIDVAMYGMSGTAPEYKALVAAATRGVQVRVVLNDDYTATTVAAIKALEAQGLPISVRVQKARTMHEKFGVVGDDVFTGSANFSESSSTKHSEDRFLVKNHAEVAAAFRARFELLWERSRVV